MSSRQSIMAPKLDPTAWARRMADAKEKARRLREERSDKIQGDGGVAPAGASSRYAPRPPDTYPHSADVAGDAHYSQPGGALNPPAGPPSRPTAAPYRSMVVFGEEQGPPQQPQPQPFSIGTNAFSGGQGDLDIAADQSFAAMLRSSEGTGRGESGRTGASGAASRRPQWNSDVSTTGDTLGGERMMQAAVGDNDASAAPPVETHAQRLARMKSELQGPHDPDFGAAAAASSLHVRQSHRRVAAAADSEPSHAPGGEVEGARDHTGSGGGTLSRNAPAAATSAAARSTLMRQRVAATQDRPEPSSPPVRGAAASSSGANANANFSPPVRGVISSSRGANAHPSRLAFDDEAVGTSGGGRGAEGGSGGYDFEAMLAAALKAGEGADSASAAAAFGLGGGPATESALKPPPPVRPLSLAGGSSRQQQQQRLSGGVSGGPSGASPDGASPREHELKLRGRLPDYHSDRGAYDHRGGSESDRGVYSSYAPTPAGVAATYGGDDASGSGRSSASMFSSPPPAPRQQQLSLLKAKMLKRASSAGMAELTHFQQAQAPPRTLQRPQSDALLLGRTSAAAQQQRLQRDEQQQQQQHQHRGSSALPYLSNTTQQQFAAAGSRGPAVPSLPPLASPPAPPFGSPLSSTYSSARSSVAGGADTVAAAGALGSSRFRRDEVPLSPPPRSAAGGVLVSAAAAAQQQPLEQQPEEEVVQLEKCDGCGRKFNPAVLEKHQRVCATVFQSKRSAFKQDIVSEETKAAGGAVPAAAATGGTKKKAGAKPSATAAASAPKAAAVTASDSGSGAPSGGGSWAAKSASLRAAMRSAREYKEALAAGKSGSDLPPPPPSEVDPDLVPCPTCGRRFSEKAAERHIPKCESIRAKPKALTKGSGMVAGTSAAAARGIAATAAAMSGSAGGAHGPRQSIGGSSVGSGYKSGGTAATMSSSSSSASAAQRPPSGRGVAAAAASTIDDDVRGDNGAASGRGGRGQQQYQQYPRDTPAAAAASTGGRRYAPSQSDDGDYEGYAASAAGRQPHSSSSSKYGSSSGYDRGRAGVDHHPLPQDSSSSRQLSATSEAAVSGGGARRIGAPMPHRDRSLSSSNRNSTVTSALQHQHSANGLRDPFDDSRPHSDVLSRSSIGGARGSRGVY